MGTPFAASERASGVFGLGSEGRGSLNGFGAVIERMGRYLGRSEGLGSELRRFGASCPGMPDG